MPGRMLIVDDQRGVRRLLEELFKKEGWDVQCAGDGREAIEKVENLMPDLDLILMDLKMPNVNGLEATRIITEKKSPPIIMMTAYGEIEVIQQALDAGATKCISKPFDIMALRDMVNKLMLEIAS
ncbi:MAG: response regulator [Syntrophomonas sp.]|nr:response regulator [Syntrophomonas sp.]